MMIMVRLFARARDLAGSDTVGIELPEGSTVAELRRQLNLTVPRLAELLQRSAIAVESEFAGDATPLQAGAEVALLPPVSGGAW